MTQSKTLKEMPSYPPWLRYLIGTLGGYALAGGLFGLLGWTIHMPRLSDWSGTGIVMKANTALAAAVGGAALLILTLHPSARGIIRGLGFLVALIGGLTLLEHLSGMNLGIDTLLFNELPGARATSAPGRMGPPASSSFVLIGLALILITQGATSRRFSAALGVAVAGIGMLSLTGYLYGAQEMYALPRLTGIALQTASIIFAIGVALFASVPDRQPMRMLLERSAAGLLVRRALPLVIALPLTLGGLRVWIQRQGLVDTAFGTALRTVVEIALVLGLLWWAAAAVRSHEKPLHESRELLRITLASIGDAVMTLDTQGRVTFLNAVAESLTGWTSREATGQPCEDVFRLATENTRQPVESPLLRALKESVIVGVANRTVLIAKDGTERPIDDSAAPIRDAKGQIVGVVLVFHDVTEQRQAERALQRSEQDLRDFFDNATVGLHWVGPDGIILRVNQTELALLGYRHEEYVGKHIAEFHADASVINEILQCLSAGQTVHEYPARMRCKDGSIKQVLVSSNVLWEAGKFIHTRCFTRDITERKQVEEALQAAQTQLQQRAQELETRVAERTAALLETNEQLEAFVYSIAHDLRTPLRSMAGFSQLLVEDHAGELNDTGVMLLKRINASSAFMDKLLLDLLAFGRTSRSEVELSPVEVRQAWEAARFQTATQAERTQARIEVIGTLPVVRAHEATLGQCLANLISNAMKFVAPGVHPHIRFHAEEIVTPSRAEEPGARVRLWVEDNGIGIPPQHQERAFRVFERLNGARYSGTGIGLSIVRKGVERMGGSMGLESDPGRGCRFWIELPMADCDPPKV